MPPALSARWRSSLSSVPPFTKSLSTAMTVMTTLGLAFRLKDLALSAYNPDAEDTSSEDSLIRLLALYALHMVILLGSGKYLERAWGSRELFKFLSITSVGTMIGIYLTYLLEYLVSGNEDLIFDTEAYGLTAVIAGFLIGFKQLVPEHSITLWGFLSIRVKSLPLLFATFTIVWVVFTHDQMQLLMTMYGLFISWIYSRFFKVQDGIRGDRSESFSFASFFPEFTHPLVKAISNMSFNALVRLRICSPTGYGGSFQYDLENPQMSGMAHTFTRPGSLRAEAERRRALALKALDMRLHAAAGYNAGLAGAGRSPFSGSGGTPNAAPVSLLSLSAEPLPSDDDDDEVLFETSAVDVNEPASKEKQESKSHDGVEDGK
ncbi:hypothetical protein BGZ70_008104 [Mortierella alpina]|uniref:Uncharacterized protein n=1 Tax=Mortierella alpina TaxID=64518 RepID=A0A9P6J4B9_MORAP|nr:hypothetical protein BGZ70_008104 [Mortierella alpina]